MSNKGLSTQLENFVQKGWKIFKGNNNQNFVSKNIKDRSVSLFLNQEGKVTSWLSYTKDRKDTILFLRTNLENSEISTLRFLGKGKKIEHEKIRGEESNFCKIIVDDKPIKEMTTYKNSMTHIASIKDLTTGKKSIIEPKIKRPTIIEIQKNILELMQQLSKP